MDQLLSELAAIDDLDSETLSGLVADLKNVDPSLRPDMVRQFRASLAFRRQLAERDAQKNAPPQSTAPEATTPSKSSPVASQHASVTEPKQLPSAPDSSDQPPGAPETNDPQAALANESVPAASSEPATPETTAEQAPTSGVVPAVLTTPAAGEAESSDWQRNLDAAIVNLEQLTRRAPRTVDEVGQHARLRMLYLVSERRDDALRPIPGILPAQQEFWSEQLFGLATYLGNDRVKDANSRAAEAKRHLENAVDKLGELGTLTVLNMAICTDVYGFGSYKKFEKLEFTPGQKVLVYAEVENYRSEPTEKGYHTSLRVSYEILDSRGGRVDQIQPPNIDDYCEGRRRDFYMRHFIDMPERLYDGTYTLQLTIEDVKGQKIGQGSIEFTVKEGN